MGFQGVRPVSLKEEINIREKATQKKDDVLETEVFARGVSILICSNGDQRSEVLKDVRT